MREDKQQICDLFCDTLRATIDQTDLKSIRYKKTDQGQETVTLIYKYGTSYDINVNMDSGIAMLRDILKNI